MIIAILGRQPKLSLAELESYFSADKIKNFTDKFALIDTDTANINNFGGILKLAKTELQFKATSYHQISKQIIDFYSKNLPLDAGKITVGVSWYGGDISANQVQKIGLCLKSKLKNKVSFRLIPNKDAVLSTATAHHNKLGNSVKKIEIIIAQNGDQISVGRSVGSQNISAYAARDQKRPKRDAKVGMLPPKLAQIIINLARPDQQTKLNLLDPFCGTGVLLQEAYLMGFNVSGSDISPKMIDFTRQNLKWLDQNINLVLEVGDATNHQWSNKIDCVASEIYLGQPFRSAPTLAQILQQKQIPENITLDFLKNIHPQIQSQTRLCLATPAWKLANGDFKTLSIIDDQKLNDLGFERITFQNITDQDLIYYRDDQIVARKLLVIQKK